MKTHMTLERGVLFFEDGTEVSNVSVELLKAAPDLLAALKSFLRAPSVGSNGPGSATIVVQDFNFRAAEAAISKATTPE